MRCLDRCSTVLLLQILFVSIIMFFTGKYMRQLVVKQEAANKTFVQNVIKKASRMTGRSNSHRSPHHHAGDGALPNPRGWQPLHQAPSVSVPATSPKPLAPRERPGPPGHGGPGRGLPASPLAAP